MTTQENPDGLDVAEYVPCRTAGCVTMRERGLISHCFLCGGYPHPGQVRSENTATPGGAG